MPAAEEGYRPGPRVQRHVVWGGLSLSQVAILGAGGAFALTVLIAAPLPNLGLLPLSFVAAMGVFAVALAAAFIPVGGLLIADRVPQTAEYAGKRARGRARWRTPAYGGGVTLGDHEDLQYLEALPAEFGDLEILSVDCPPGPVGMVHDRRGRTIAACSRVHLRSLGLLGREDQIGRYAAWGRILDVIAPELAADPNSRLQLLKRAVPRRTNELAAWLERNVVDPDCPQARDLFEIAAAGGMEREHELFVVMRRSVRSAYRARDRAAMLHDSALELAAQLEGVEGQLRDAEIALHRPERLLSDRQYARLIKDQVDPFDREMRDLLERETGESGVDPRHAWPDFTDEHAGFWRADSADHVAWWVKGWPTRSVQPGWLRPLMLASSVILNVSLVMKPVDEEVAMRHARASIVAEETSRRTRERAQQVERRQHRESQEHAQRQEDELGVHSLWRWEANLSASFPIGDERARQEGVKAVRRACSRSHLKPVQMHCLHERHFVRTLPFARGLRDR
ncbi:MAG: hypothetical protein JO152_00325 [Mycobacteriaceae bacterium]|nr:hypothetical protein [Mycobacteriaceae bacterium]